MKGEIDDDDLMSMRSASARKVRGRRRRRRRRRRRSASIANINCSSQPPGSAPHVVHALRSHIAHFATPSQFTTFVADKEFFPRQVANFLDLDQCMKMLLGYLNGATLDDSRRQKFLPRILSSVIHGVLLNNEVITSKERPTFAL